MLLCHVNKSWLNKAFIRLCCRGVLSFITVYGIYYYQFAGNYFSTLIYIINSFSNIGTIIINYPPTFKLYLHTNN